MTDRQSNVYPDSSGKQNGRRTTIGQGDFPTTTTTTTYDGQDQVTALGNLKQGYFMKRHRNRKTYSERFLRLDLDRSVLSYYQTPGGRDRRSSLLDIFKAASKKVKSPSGQEDFKVLRQLPLEAVECHAVPGESLDCEECRLVLVVSYREVQGPYKPTITRSVYFISKEDDEDQAEQEILEWYSAIMNCRRTYHGKKVARARSLGAESMQSAISETSCIVDALPVKKPPKLQKRQPTEESITEEDDDDDEEEEEVVALYKCGWVYKKGLTSPSKWNARFLVLDDFRLRYFKAPMEALPQNESPLYYGDWRVRDGMPDMFPETNHPYCFTVQLATREYYFRTDCADDTASWIETLKRLNNTHCRHRHASRTVEVEPVPPRRKSYDGSQISATEAAPVRAASVPGRVGPMVRTQTSITLHNM